MGQSTPLALRVAGRHSLQLLRSPQPPFRLRLQAVRPGIVLSNDPLDLRLPSPQTSAFVLDVQHDGSANDQ